MATFVAHISDIARSSAGQSVLLFVIVTFCVCLALEHAFVKYDGLHKRQLLSIVGSILVVVLAAVLAPLPGLAQSSEEPRGLPDLISDPPAIARTRFIRSPQGEILRVMTFDGFIHNIGTGKLEVSGNPQIEGGMKQRVFDGSEWIVVGTPTVRFENDDGHNHFHLIRAMEYSLWSADRTEQVLDASKIGFCLVDTEQMEEAYESNYLISDHNYCGVDDPGTTDLVMGITPGWRDTYDANVSLQWVDIGDIRPGLYWVAAVTDPNNEIVESNEDNNGIVFSERIHAVDGYVAIELEQQVPSTPIQLRSRTYGTVGERAYVVAVGPEHGRLDVPVGVDLIATDTITYTPDPGYAGIDTFSYYAHDITSPFPSNPALVVVEIAVADEETTQASDSSTPDLTITIAPEPAQAWPIYDPVHVDFELQEPTSSRVEWFASGLPSGLSIDPATGVVGGSPSFPSSFESTIVAWADGVRAERTVQWEIEEVPAPPLQEIADLSSPLRTFLRHSLGDGTEGATYVAEGLPDGISLTQNSPSVTGVARQIGEFQITVQELIEDEIVKTIDFTWTIRPSARPEFAL